MRRKEVELPRREKGKSQELGKREGTYEGYVLADLCWRSLPTRCTAEVGESWSLFRPYFLFPFTSLPCQLSLSLSLCPLDLDPRIHLLLVVSSFFLSPHDQIRINRLFTFHPIASSSSIRFHSLHLKKARSAMT